jgi:hypothetical protein
MAKKSKFPIFVITLVIGIGLIAVAFLQPDFIFGDSSQPFDLSSFVGLSLIEVPIDPTGGQILGTVKFGAPIVKPFERSGTIITADGLGSCIRLQEGEIRQAGALYEVPFGRIGSGDRNAEVSFHGYNGVNCAFGYAEWDLAELPNDFEATSVRFQLNLKSVQGRGTATNNSMGCSIIFLANSFDQIGANTIGNRILWGSLTGGATNQFMYNTLIPLVGFGDFVAWGTSQYLPAIHSGFGTSAPSTGEWCRTTGVKSFTFGQIRPDGTFDAQAGVDAFNKAVSGGAFDQGTRTDKFTLGFYAHGIGSGNMIIDQQWWEENGSLLVTGASDPIRCDIGFRQVDFRCVPIVCDITFQLNQVTNECEPIQCEAGENLQVISEFGI